jgi:Mn-dependent DtxR family transcriptional regulator
MGEWTLFSNHGHVLVCLANNNEARLRDVAAEVGITERAVQNILRELQSAGIVQVSKHGRCNRYQINSRKSLRHPLEAHCSVGKLLALLKTAVAEAETSEPLSNSTAVEETAAPAPAPQDKPVAAKPAAAKPLAQKPSPSPTPDKPLYKAPEKIPGKDPHAQQVEAKKADHDKSKAVKAAGKKPAEDKAADKKVDKKDESPSTHQGSLF